MPSYEIDYASKHLHELFHDARLGEEVIIVREDGVACELTPLAEVRSLEPAVAAIELPAEPNGAPGELVPA